MSSFSKVLRGLSLFYPLVILCLRGQPFFIEVGLGFFALLTLDLLWRSPLFLKILSLATIVGLAISLRGVDATQILRLYPFFMSLSVLSIFLTSKNPSDNPMIGPMRSRIGSDLKLLGILHDAKIIWIVGLGLNTLILGVLVFAFRLETWALYANFYSYILLLILFAFTVLFVWSRKRQAS